MLGSRLSSMRALRAAPVGARMLRTTPARLGMLTTPMPSTPAATIDVDKFVTGESVEEHQVRVRHDNSGYRTHNYAVIGEPLPDPAVPVGGGWVGCARGGCCLRDAGGSCYQPEPWHFLPLLPFPGQPVPSEAHLAFSDPPPLPPVRLRRRCALHRCVARAPGRREVPRADEPLG